MCSTDTLVLPGGNWRSYCSPVSFFDGFLVANCGLGKGRLSTINTRLCAPGSAINNAYYSYNAAQESFVNGPGSGILLCEKPASTAPAGPWYLTCAPQVIN